MKFPNQYRIESGPMASSPLDEFGAFMIPHHGNLLRIIAADAQDPAAQGWEHVSVSLKDRCPIWEEMCFVKELFWDPEDCVVQFHPPKSNYVNVHPHCLHLWRKVDAPFPTPPKNLIA